jgi:CheY-like chemotaxis protein
MVIDDDALALQTFAGILKSHGYTVLAASDARAGVDQLERAEPVALLLDLHLDSTDGLSFLRQLRASPRHGGLRVAVMTGDYFVEEAVARELRALGAELHFKPLWEEDLLRIAQGLFDGTVSPGDRSIGSRYVRS